MLRGITALSIATLSVGIGRYEAPDFLTEHVFKLAKHNPDAPAASKVDIFAAGREAYSKKFPNFPTVRAVAGMLAWGVLHVDLLFTLPLFEFSRHPSLRKK